MLLSYENEAIFAERSGEEVEHHNPPTTFLIENPFAVLNTSEHPQEAQAFKDFLYSTEGQRAWGEAGFRPVDQAVAKEFADEHPAPEQALHGRRARRLGQGQRRALRARDRVRGEDLRRGDELMSRDELTSATN